MKLFAALLLFCAPALVVGCGGRTGLGATNEQSAPVPTAGIDSGEIPTADAGHLKSCTEEGITYIYVITDQAVLFRFDPPTAAFKKIGPVNCDDSGSSPNSMAVDRTGRAFVDYHGGQLFEVDVGTASCRSTPFSPGPLGWTQFGMGYSTGGSTNGETLYVAQSDFSAESEGIASLDTTSFTLNFIGPFSEPLGTAIELTGTGDGRLFALGITSAGDSQIAEVDPMTAQVLSRTPVFGTDPIIAFAFAFWAGDFYTFTTLTSGSTTRVHRFRPTDGSLTQVAQLTGSVVGAGVSTCAPSVE